MGDGGVFRTPCADFSRPVEELEYTCLMKSTFSEVSHDRGFKTCQTPASYPECVFCGKMYRWKTTYVECHMDPNILEQQQGSKGLSQCAESQSTSCVPNRTRFLAVQTAIRTKMRCDKKSLLAAADVSKKRNLMVVGGYSDNVVDLCGEGNTDVKSQYLGKGHTMLTKEPSQAEFEECWSESLSLLYIHRHTGTQV
jgi:hypothetical protein